MGMVRFEPARPLSGGVVAPTRRRWPLQADFAVVALLILVVAGAGSAFVHFQSEADAGQAAQADATFAANRAAHQIQQSFEAIQGASAPTASSLAAGPTFTDASQCTLSYAPVGPFDKGHIDIVRLDGSVVCSSLISGHRTAYAGQPWLQSSTPTLIAPAVVAR